MTNQQYSQHELDVKKKAEVKYRGSYKFSPFTVVCCFVCKLCKDLSQELLILLLYGRKIGPK